MTRRGETLGDRFADNVILESAAHRVLGTTVPFRGSPQKPVRAREAGIAVVAALVLVLSTVTRASAQYYSGGARIYCNLESEAVPSRTHLAACHCAGPYGASGLGHLNARCAVQIDPTCPALEPLRPGFEDVGGPEFQRLGVGGTYSRVMLPPEERQKRFAKDIIHLVYPTPAPRSRIDSESWKRVIDGMKIALLPPSNSDVAEYSSPPPEMDVNGKLMLNSTLAEIVTAVGHELIHATQHFRKMSAKGFDAMSDPFADPFLEYEAWVWTTNEPGFTWDLAPNPAAKCLEPSTLTIYRRGVACYAWRIGDALHALLVDPKYERRFPLLEAFIRTNWWTYQHWYPQHRNWPVEFGPKFTVPSPPSHCERDPAVH